MSDTGTEQESSYNIIRNSLRQYGLEGLETFIGQMVFESGIVDAEQVLARLRVEPDAGRSKTPSSRDAANLTSPDCCLPGCSDSSGCSRREPTSIRDR